MLSSGLIPRRLNFVCQRFGTLCLFHLHRRVGMKNDWGRECWDICPNIPNPSHSSFGIYSPTFPTPAILHLGYIAQHSQPQPFFIWVICPNILNPSHSSFGIYAPTFTTPAILHLGYMPQHSQPQPFFIWDVYSNILNPSHSSFGIYAPAFSTPVILHLGCIPQHSQPQPFFIWDIYPKILNPSHSSYLPAYEDGTVFRNVGIQNSDARELPRRKHITFRTRRNLKSRIILHMLSGSCIFEVNGKRKKFSWNTTYNLFHRLSLHVSDWINPSSGHFTKQRQVQSNAMITYSTLVVVFVGCRITTSLQ